MAKGEGGDGTEPAETPPPGGTAEDLYRILFDLSVVGQAQVMPATGKLLMVNDRFCEITGYSREELLRTTVRELTHPDDRATDWEKFSKMVRGETPEYENEKHYVRKDGQVIWVHAAARAIRDVGGNAVRTVGMIMDITERKRAEEALTESDKRKSEFLAVLSHELRNPLAPIRNSLYLLEHAPPGGAQAKRAQAVIERQVSHLARLVDDLLDLTRISRGKIQLHLEWLELGELVRRCVEDYRASFAESGVELQALLTSEPLWLRIDGTRITQALGNLLSNGLKFTPRGGRVEVTLLKEGERALLRIGDTGVGVAPNMLGRLFEPFSQAAQTLARSRGGIGLGLALVKGLVELHGGQVDATSEGLGRGAQFTIRLPIRGRAMTGAGAGEPRAARAVRRVLIIEDNVDAAHTLREALELNGHQVLVAYDGKEGIEKAIQFNPEVLLCDIGLPRMDGYEVARAFRADPTLRSIYLVALTGYALPEDLIRAREAGFDRHLAKPLSIDQINEVLAAAPMARGKQRVPTGDLVE